MKYLHRMMVVALCAALAACAATTLHREGLAEVDRGEYETGVNKLTEAVAKDPNNLSFKLDLAARRGAAVQKLIGAADRARAEARMDEAIATYRRALTIEPTNQRALHGIEGVQADRRHGAMVVDAAKAFERKDYDAADAILHIVLQLSLIHI